MAVQRSDCLRHEGWEVFIYVGWDAFDRAFVGRAELYLDDSFKCRIGLNRDFESADDAAEFLASSTRSFISDWRGRDHPADSDFSEL